MTPITLKWAPGYVLHRSQLMYCWRPELHARYIRFVAFLRKRK